MRKKNEHLPHEIEIDQSVGKLTAYTKKGKPVVSLFDATDLDKIKDYGNWRAIWSTEFDCQIIEAKTYGGGHAKRTSVAAVILGSSPNAPIRHLNGDFLDNRQSNLEIYDVKAQPNAYQLVESDVIMALKDRYGRVVGECLIDETDLDFVINQKHVWLKKRRPSGQPYVVNVDGLLLAHHLLQVETGFVQYENKNPLDNRRQNIKIEAMITD